MLGLPQGEGFNPIEGELFGEYMCEGCHHLGCECYIVKQCPAVGLGET